MSESRSAIWVDANGRTRQTLPVCDSAVANASLQAALLAKSNATVFSYFEGPQVFPGGSPAVGTYLAVTDAAILSFLCVDGTIVSLTLPAPDSTIFLSDQETVDATQITAIIAASIGHLTSASGSLANSFIGGIRK